MVLWGQGEADEVSAHVLVLSNATTDMCVHKCPHSASNKDQTVMWTHKHTQTKPHTHKNLTSRIFR